MELTALDDEFPALLVAGSVAPGEVDIADELRARGADVLIVPELGRTMRPWQDAVALAKLYRLLRKIRPEIVETHCSKAGALGRVAAAAAGVPVRVHTMHALVFEDFHPAAGNSFALAERGLAKITTQLVAINEWQANELEKVYRVCRRDRISVINIGRELDSVAEPDSEARSWFRAELDAGHRPVIAMVARMVPVKNQLLLMQAAARLKAEGNDYIYAFAGGGPDEQLLREHATSLGVADDVRFLGFRRDLDRVYAGSDLVVLTSNNEAMGFCLIEAMAAGVPVVATAVGGVPDLLEHGRLGRLVPPRDAAALAAAIRDTLEQGEGARLSEEQRTAVRTRYGTARLLDETRTLYRKLVDETHKN